MIGKPPRPLPAAGAHRQWRNGRRVPRAGRAIAPRCRGEGSARGHDGRCSEPGAPAKEALLLSQVNHPNVATVHYFGTQDEVTFLAMEYVQGTTLDTLLAGKPLSETEVRRLGVQLAQGLKAAHAHGVIHRDLKPRNLRITSDGLLKILDFGLAQQWQPNADLLSTLGPGDKSSLATSGTSPGIEGTVPYMPPEQLRGGELDVRSDIYSAGMVLYEMAAGKRPFATLNGPPLVAAILSEPPVPPHELDARISVDSAAPFSRRWRRIPLAVRAEPRNYRRISSGSTIRCRKRVSCRPAGACRDFVGPWPPLPS